jgi:hypothetical protein
MSLLDECIQSLAQDVGFEYVHGLISMEQDVNSFIKSAGHDRESRIAALDELAGVVKSQGWREQFEESFWTTSRNNGTTSPIEHAALTKSDLPLTPVPDPFLNGSSLGAPAHASRRPSLPRYPRELRRRNHRPCQQSAYRPCSV